MGSSRGIIKHLFIQWKRGIQRAWLGTVILKNLYYKQAEIHE